MKRKELYPFIRGKPNLIFKNTIHNDGAHLRKVNDIKVYDIQGESLPRGAPVWEAEPMIQRSITQSEGYSEVYSTAGKCTLIVSDYLPRGEPQGLKNCKPSQESMICMSQAAKCSCQTPNDCFREIFGKGGIIHTF